MAAPISAMFLLKERARGGRDVNMCQLMEHAVNNVIVLVYVCVERLGLCASE